jgi:hypothetical protein
MNVPAGDVSRDWNGSEISESRPRQRGLFEWARDRWVVAVGVRLQAPRYHGGTQMISRERIHNSGQCQLKSTDLSGDRYDPLVFELIAVLSDASGITANSVAIRVVASRCIDSHC